ncbi:uncharacterized protein LOC119333442, partial [Triticum dicoccoides]|uniref:uncharacterized protein LOC119333442 n=1 Tax=Triticum dicoccoides TaxID=85692 RepID=UPI0018918E94
MAGEAFLQLKKMLTTPPVLAAPAAKEPMLLYIAATSWVVNTVIVVERPEDGRAQLVQRPVYYFSESLQRLLKPSIKPSLESESIFMPAAPGAVGSNSGAASVGPGTSAGGSGAAAVAPGPGTSEPGPGATTVSPGTSTMQQVAADSTPPPPNPSALVSVAVMTVNEVEAPSWAHPILNLLVSGELPTDEISARQVQHRAGAYTIVNRELVRRIVTGVFQRCVESGKGKAILRDIHQGECGHHAASRSLVAKAFRHGFFWPTALEDAKDLVKKCKGCQKFSSKQHLSASALKTTPLTWPFAVWG